MNFDINAEFDAGKSSEEILEQVSNYLKEKENERKAAEERKRLEQVEKETAREQLKREARAYAINAVLAYIEAFDLLPEGETIEMEDVEKLEGMLIQFEELLPLYIKMMKMQDDFDIDFGLDK